MWLSYVWRKADAFAELILVGGTTWCTAQIDEEEKMTKHYHNHGGYQKHALKGNPKPHWKNIHKDWRLWVAVCVMLAAVLIYVFTLDDSLLRVAP